jgi:hypothetical protein
LDADEHNVAGTDGLSGVIHNVTEPKLGQDSWTISVDSEAPRSTPSSDSFRSCAISACGSLLSAPSSRAELVEAIAVSCDAPGPHQCANDLTGDAERRPPLAAAAPQCHPGLAAEA